MALSGATPLRQVQRLQWQAGKPLAAASDLRPAASDSAGDCASDDGCSEQAVGDRTARKPQPALYTSGRAPQATASSAASGSSDASNDAAAEDAAAGLAALRRGPVGCGGAEGLPCSDQTDLNVTLSAMEIRTFLVQLGEDAAGVVPIVGRGGYAAADVAVV